MPQRPQRLLGGVLVLSVRNLSVLVAVASISTLLGSCAEPAPASNASTTTAHSSTQAPSTTRASGIDYDAWTRDLSAVGFDDVDIDGLEDLTQEVCGSSDYEIELLLAQSLDQSGQDMVDMQRVNFNYVCPDQLPRFDAARASIAESSNASKTACDTPPAERTEQQSMLAEMLAC